MRPELEKYHQIDLYLNGELSGEDLEAFKLLMKSDASLAEEIELQKEVNFVVEGAVYAQIREQIQKDITVFDQKAKFRKKLWYGAAGIFLMALSLLMFNFFKSQLKEKEHQVNSEIKTATYSNDHDLVTIENNKITTSPIDQEERREKLNAPKKEKKVSLPSVNLITPNSSGQRDSVINKPGLITFPQGRENATAVLEPIVLPTPVHLDSALQPLDISGCSGLKFEIAPLIEPACKGESNGKVTFQLSSIKGGKSPYQVSLEKNVNATKTDRFYHLSSGEHVFYLKDSKGCTETINLVVPESQCLENKFVLNTVAGEVWQIPATSQDYLLTIFDRSGRVVYKRKSGDIFQSQWMGMDMNGSYLESGLYIYVIEYNDGKKQNGQLSIVK